MSGLALCLSSKNFSRRPGEYGLRHVMFMGMLTIVGIRMPASVVRMFWGGHESVYGQGRYGPTQKSALYIFKKTHEY
jgi:hypothetical protein